MWDGNGGVRRGEGRGWTLAGEPLLVAFVAGEAIEETSPATLEALRAELRGLGASLLIVSGTAAWRLGADDALVRWAPRGGDGATTAEDARAALGLGGRPRARRTAARMFEYAPPPAQRTPGARVRAPTRRAHHRRGAAGVAVRRALHLPQGARPRLVRHRPRTIQRVALGARTDGTLVAVRHDVLAQTSRFDEFMEPAGYVTRMLYACPAVRTSHRLVRLDVHTPTFTRARRGERQLRPRVRDGRAGDGSPHRSAGAAAPELR